MANESTTELAKRPPTKVEVLKNIMASPSVQEQFKNVLAENAGVFTASIIDLFNSDTYLQNCEPKQVVMECLKAAVLKLPINKALGFAYIVPFNENKLVNGAWTKQQVPSMQIGYKGLIQLAMRTGQYKTINADRVYAGELQRVDKLTGEFDISGTKTSDEIVGYFAHIQMLNGFSKTLYMTTEQVTKHAKKYSKSYNTEKSPWKTEFEAMAIKTVLRNLLSHYGFLSVEMIGAVSRDIDSDTVEDITAEYIRDNANRQEMGFTEAELVNDTNGKQQPEAPKDDCPI